jgi:hypothetical protein
VLLVDFFKIIQEAIALLAKICPVWSPWPRRTLMATKLFPGKKTSSKKYLKKQSRSFFSLEHSKTVFFSAANVGV